MSIVQGDDYTTSCLVEFAYFENNYRVTAADLSKQKNLDAGSRVIHQIISTGKIKLTAANIRVTTLSKNQKKQYHKSLKEQQQFCN